MSREYIMKNNIQFITLNILYLRKKQKNIV